MIESIIIILIVVFVLVSRNSKNENVYKYFSKTIKKFYEKYAPYSFKVARDKAKELGQEYSTRQYIIQVLIFGAAGAVIAYLYFRSITWAIVYAIVAISFIPYLAILRCKRIYSEYVFELIQIYTTNVIMEFNTTQSFVKALEGVKDSGVLEDPVLSDVSKMIDMAYDNGTIEESIEFFNKKYPYYMVKNMHQLFLQITNEGAHDSGEALEGMMNDIDALVEGVYRDKMDRAAFHTKFITFGVALYLLVMLVQFLLGTENYIIMLNKWYIQLLLHAVIILNSFFLIKGEKFYNEDTGVE